jgi:hypothetical protein
VTEQITIKLNKDQFRPLLDRLQAHAGHGISSSDSDLVGKAVLFTFNIIVPEHDNQEGKTIFEQLLECKKKNKSEAIISFLNDYSFFKKASIEEYIQKKNKDDW